MYYLNGRIIPSKEEEKDLAVISHKSLKQSIIMYRSGKEGHEVIGMMRQKFSNFQSNPVINYCRYKSLVRPHKHY